jgi:hypothetical protein
LFFGRLIFGLIQLQSRRPFFHKPDIIAVVLNNVGYFRDVYITAIAVNLAVPWLKMRPNEKEYGLLPRLQ